MLVAESCARVFLIIAKIKGRRWAEWKRLCIIIEAAGLSLARLCGALEAHGIGRHAGVHNSEGIIRGIANAESTGLRSGRGTPRTTARVYRTQGACTPNKRPALF